MVHAQECSDTERIGELMEQALECMKIPISAVAASSCSIKEYAGRYLLKMEPFDVEIDGSLKNRLRSVQLDYLLDFARDHCSASEDSSCAQYSCEAEEGSELDSSVGSCVLD